jgi:hypothetical protein
MIYELCIDNRVYLINKYGHKIKRFDFEYNNHSEFIVLDKKRLRAANLYIKTQFRIDISSARKLYIKNLYEHWRYLVKKYIEKYYESHKCDLLYPNGLKYNEPFIYEVKIKE